MSEIDELIPKLQQAITPPVGTVRQILNIAKPIFEKEPNILDLKSPITVCGDTHGQLEDVIYLFELSGQLPNVRYLFLGDYVDRGYYSVESLCLLLCFKIKYPDSLYLLRGNHETRAVNKTYGFYDEIITKYKQDQIWSEINDLFDYFPIAAIINNQYFCVHGGLSPDLLNLSNLRVYSRVCEPDITSFVGHLMWSDPGEVDDWKRTERRSGYLFGAKHCKQFLDENNLKMIVRSHEMVNGYEISCDGLLVTVWSAPNYCYFCGNLASFMKIADDGFSFTTFEAMPEERRMKPPPLPACHFSC